MSDQHVERDPEAGPWYFVPLAIIGILFAYMAVEAIEVAANNLPVSAHTTR